MLPKQMITISSPMPCLKFQYPMHRIISPFAIRGGELWLHIETNFRELKPCLLWNVNNELIMHSFLGGKADTQSQPCHLPSTEFSTLLRVQRFQPGRASRIKQGPNITCGKGNTLSCSNSRLAVRTIELPRCNSFIQIIIEQYQALDMEQTSR